MVAYVILIYMIVNRDNLLAALKSAFPFNQADVDQLSWLAEKSEVVFYKKGDVIYREGTNARYLYIVFEGKVEILKETNRNVEKKNLLSSGAFFGEDILAEKNQRKTSARALQDSLLIRIALPILTRFIQNNPDLRGLFQLLANSYKAQLATRQNLDLEGETIHFVNQPHKIYLIAKAAFFLIFTLLAGSAVQYSGMANLIPAKIAMWLLIFIFAIYAVWLLWNIAEWMNDLFIFTNRRVIHFDRSLFLYESREETPLDAVVSLTSQVNLLGRQFGFGDLSVKTFTGMLQLKNLPEISAAQCLLEFLIDRAQIGKQQEERKDFENLLRARRGLNFERPTEENAVSEQDGQERRGVTEVGSLYPAGAGAGAKRGQAEQTTVYRTHWLFLLRKIMLPSLAFSSLVLITVFLYLNAPFFQRSSVIQVSLAVLILLALGWWFYQYLDWRNDLYIITPEQLIDVYRKPLGLEDKRSAPLESIQSIRYKRQGLLGLIFNYGTVFVKVGNEDFTFDNVYQPMKIQQTLFGYLERANLIEKQASLAEQRRQMVDWMDTYQRFSREHPDHFEKRDKQDKLE